MTLAMEESGKGDPVLLLHGCPSTTRCFAALADALTARGRRVLVPSLPGYGASPPLAAPYDWRRASELLEQELLGRDAAKLDVVGFSAGAYRALMLALSPRLRVARIVCLAGIAGLDEAVRGAYREIAGAARAGVDFGPSWLGRMTGPQFSERCSKDDGDDVMAWLDCTPTGVLADELEGFAAADDLRPRLGEIDARIVARVGAFDVACPPMCSEEIVKGARQGELQVVPDCGHALLYEDRAATIAAVVAAITTG